MTSCAYHVPSTKVPTHSRSDPVPIFLIRIMEMAGIMITLVSDAEVVKDLIETNHPEKLEMCDMCNLRGGHKPLFLARKKRSFQWPNSAENDSRFSVEESHITASKPSHKLLVYFAINIDYQYITLKHQQTLHWNSPT